MGEGRAQRRYARSQCLAVNRMESNFVMNPGHPEFGRITHAPAQPFDFNPRFFAIG